MKKLILVAGLSSMLLVGCVDEEDYTKIESSIIVTDVKIDLEIKEGDRHNAPSHTISYNKQGVETGKRYRITEDLAYNIKDIKEIEKLTSSEEALFDVVTNGKTISAITLSKNRK